MRVLVPGEFFRDDRLQTLSSLVKSSPVCAGGLVIALWSWASEATTDGVIAPDQVAALAGALGWKPSGEALLAVLRRAGFLAGWAIVDFSLVTAGLSRAQQEKARQRNREKQARHRARLREARVALRGEAPVSVSIPPSLAASAPAPAPLPAADLWGHPLPAPVKAPPVKAPPKPTKASEAYWLAAEEALGRKRPKTDKSLREWGRLLLDLERSGVTPDQLRGAGWYYQRQCPRSDGFPLNLNIITRDTWLGPVVSGIEPIDPDLTPKAPKFTKGAAAPYGGAAITSKRPTGIIEPSGEYRPPTLKWRIRGQRADGTYVGRETSEQSGSAGANSPGALSEMLG